MRPGISKRICASWFAACVCCAALNSADAAAPPAVKDTLAYRPVQKRVDYETPKPGEYAQCKVEVEKRGKTSGWVVRGAAGQVLRRFIDTNGDNIVDQWRYYRNGLEVYRDIDANFNNKVDQYRWFNTGGSRWGLDTNEDGRIDSWKVLSPEEAGREAVLAVIGGNERALQAVLITEDDISSLGINAGLSKKLLESVADAGTKMRRVVSGSKSISSRSTYLRFDGSQPSAIPADAGKATRDLTVYENTMAIIQTGEKTSLVQIGELVRVGETWKLTQVPQPLEANTVTAGGILMQPSLAAATTGAASTNASPEMQKLLNELQKLDSSSPAPTAGRTTLARYNSQRADLMGKLVSLSKSSDERDQWTRQMADGIAAAVQSGGYAEGLTRLKSLEASAKRSSKDSEILAYVSYRRLLAEYSVELTKATSNNRRQKVQEWWLKELETYATTFAKSTDAPDALLQLAITLEFGGKIKDARKWYDKLESGHASSNAGQRAAGAVRRLDLKGKSLQLSGSGLNGGTVRAADFRGKVLLVAYWATWCKPCTEDLPQIRALYQQYRSQGFEILGVNLDSTTDPIQPYLTQHRVTWSHIREDGGLESEPAKRFGIISLPTMILVDSSGKVVNRSVSVADLKALLPELLKKK